MIGRSQQLRVFATVVFDNSRQFVFGKKLFFLHCTEGEFIKRRALSLRIVHLFLQFCVPPVEGLKMCIC